MSDARNWNERVASDEAARFEGFAAEIRALQKANAQGKPLTRGLHAKAHVGVVGKLIVADAVPAALRAGAFAEAGREWPAYVRFSNGNGRKQHDGIPDVRGVAVKLVGVPGKKVIPGLEDKLTQDFLLIPSSTFAFRSPDEFMKFVRIAAARPSPLMLAVGILRTFGLGGGLRLLKKLADQGTSVTSMVKTRFFTSAPIRIGDAAAKIAIFPIAGASSPPEPPLSATKGRDAFREELVHALAHGTIEYSVRAQPFVDDASTPIEDASVPWSEANNPYVEIGRLVIPRQDVTTPRGKEIEELIEKLSFDPWHALEEHRPLGAVMRARAAAYRESVVARGAASEPDTVLSLP